MPELADLILGGGDPDDDLDLALEDAELAKQLAQLRAKRDALEARQEGGGAGEGATSHRESEAEEDPTRAGTLTGGYPTASPSGAAGRPATGTMAPAAPTQGLDTSPAAEAPPQSLADALAGQDVEGEIEAMERELEAQLAEFRAQQRGSSAAAGGAAEAAPGDHTEAASGDQAASDAASAGERAATASSRPETQSRPEAVSGFTTTARGDREGVVATEAAEPEAEIQALLGEVALMEEAFPDAAEGEAGAAVRRRRPLPHEERRVPKIGAPLEPGVLEMRSALEDIENRLQDIQSRQVKDAPMPNFSAEPVEASSESTRAISEMQAQNKHLRERLAASGAASGRGPTGGKGLLGLERGLFT